MPLIPTQKGFIPTDVPGPSGSPLAGSTSVGNALAGFGEKMENVGYALLNKVKQAEAQDAVATAETDDYQWSMATQAELKKKFGDGYVRDQNGEHVIDPVTKTRRTISQEFRDQADARFQTNQERMPSELAQGIYKDRQSRWFGSQIGSVYNDEQVMKVTNFDINTEKQLQQDADQFISTPSIDLAAYYSRADSMKDRLSSNAGAGGLYSQEDADKRYAKHSSTLAYSNAEGRILNILERSRSKEPGFNARIEAGHLLTQLDGNDFRSKSRRELGLQTMADALTPEQQDRLRKELLSITKVSEKLNEADFNEAVQDLYGEAKVGPGRGRVHRSAQDLDAAMLGMGAKFVQTGQISEEQLVRRRAILQANAVVGSYINTPSFARLPEMAQRAKEEQANKDLDKRLEALIPPGSLFKDTIGGVARETLHNEFKTEVEKLAAKNKADPAQYSQDVDPRVSAKLWGTLNPADPKTIASPQFGKAHMISKRDVDSKNPGYDVNKTYFSKDYAQRTAEAFMSPDLPSATKADAIWQAAAKNPEAYQDLMGQLRKEGLLDYSWAIVDKLPNQRLASEFVSTQSKMNQADDQNFRQYLDSLGQTEEVFKRTIYPKFSKFAEAIQQEHPWSNNQAKLQSDLQKFFEKKTSMIMRSPQGGGDAAKSADLAYQALVGNSTHVFSLTRGGGMFSNDTKSKVSIRIPKTLPGGYMVTEDDHAVLNDWQKQNLTVEGVAKLDFLLPKNMAAAGISKERAVQAITANISMVGDPAHPGMVNFRYRTQWDQSEALLLRKTKDGHEEPYSIPIQEILKNRKTPGEGTLEKILKVLSFDHDSVDPY